MKTGDWVAIYAALVSTIALVWNIHRAYTDRGKLSVGCSWREGNRMSRETEGGGRFSISTGGIILSWTITNVGKRPLTIRNVGPVQSESGKECVFHQVHKTLAPSEQVTFETSFNKKDAIKLIQLSAWDTEDREYRAAVKDFEALKAIRDL
jgi:hypothetical protein